MVGSKNKRHVYTTSDLPRIDSFRVHNMIHYDKYYPYYQHKEIMTVAGVSIYWTYPQKWIELSTGARIELSSCKTIDEWTSRWYFLCPYCHSRRRHLYKFFERGFLCRDCLNLGYRSSQESRFDRTSRQIEKILERLEYNGRISAFDFCMGHNYPSRPKRMHWKTYIKLSNELLKKRNEYFDALEDYFTWTARERKIFNK